MAISHIPRSVGHNFTPEYQISGIPFAINLNGNTSSTIKRIAVRKADGLVVGTLIHGNDNVTNNGVLTDADIFNDVNTKTKAGLKGTFGVIRKIEFPKIVQWVKFYCQKEADSIYYFSRNEASRTLLSKLTVTDITGVAGQHNSTEPLYMRFVDLYVSDSNMDTQIVAGLTTIDRSEFTEVVEKFYGDITAEDL